MPEGAVYVGPPTKWENPFRVDLLGIDEATRRHREAVTHPQGGSCFREKVRAELRGKDLACRRPLDKPCHADVLLEIANG